jgi:hypothetical protein
MLSRSTWKLFSVKGFLYPLRSSRWRDLELKLDVGLMFQRMSWIVNWEDPRYGTRRSAGFDVSVVLGLYSTSMLWRELSLEGLLET